MANPTNKLTVIKDGVTYLCQTYISAEDATPTGGSCLKVLNNGVECYLGLSKTQDDNASPLRVLKDGVTYYITKAGKNGGSGGSDTGEYIRISITPSANQTIRLTCKGVNTDVTTATGSKTVSIPVGEAYTITVIPDTGYNAGTISGVATSGTVTSALDGKAVTVSAASKKKIAVTINNPEGAAISVTCNGVKKTASFEGEYGDTVAFSFVNNTGYEGGTLKVNGSTTLPTTLTAALTVTVEGIADVKYTVTLNKGEHIAIVLMSVDGVAVASGGKVTKGKTLNVTAVAEAGYAEPTITFS